MKFSHKTLIFIAGFVWLAIGIGLLSLGIHFVLETVRNPALAQIIGCFSFTSFLSRFVPDRMQAIMLGIVLALMLGYIKGRLVLAKTVARQIKRIASLPNPASLKYLYSKSYYLLIASMIFLGMMMRYFPITLDTRGAIDIAIGSALINGATLFYRALVHHDLLKKRDI